MPGLVVSTQEPVARNACGQPANRRQCQSELVLSSQGHGWEWGRYIDSGVLRRRHQQGQGSDV